MAGGKGTIDIDFSEIKGWDILRKELKELYKNVQSTKPIMRDIAIVIQNRVVENFRAKKDSSGSKWVPVSEGYAKYKRKSGRKASNLLQWDGTLKNSIANGMIVTKNTAGVGTNVSYAMTHNFGSTKKSIPKREFMHINKMTRNNIKKILIHTIYGGLYE